MILPIEPVSGSAGAALPSVAGAAPLAAGSVIAAEVPCQPFFNPCPNLLTAFTAPLAAPPTACPATSAPLPIALPTPARLISSTCCVSKSSLIFICVLVISLNVQALAVVQLW